MNKRQPWTIDHYRMLTAWQQEGRERVRLTQLLQPGSELWARLMAVYEQVRALPRRTRRALQHQLACSLTGVALLLTVSEGPALAATIPVVGGCTLVDAITAANTDTATGSCPAGSGADTIVLPPMSTQTLTTANNDYNGLPVITSTITIVGNDSTIMRSAGAPNFRILDISNTSNLTLIRVTISGGNALAVGGAWNHGTLTLSESTVTGNQSFNTAGVLNQGTLVVSNSTISDNLGGGLFSNAAAGVTNYAGGLVIITNAVISNNMNPGAQGGVSNPAGGTVIVANSLISDNQGKFSGGISNDGGTLVVVNSTI